MWRLSAGALALAAAAFARPGVAAGASWSPAATITSCPAAAQPRVVFPSADPHTASGPGAILWTGDPVDCVPGRQAGVGVGLAPVGPDGTAGPAGSLPQALVPPSALGGLAGAAGTGDGRIVVAAGVGSGQPGALGLLEGRVGARFGAVVPLRSRRAPLAIATSYVGDVALASVNLVDGRIVLRIQRHGAQGMARPTLIRARPTPVSALAVGLDYRGDAMVVWAQDGWIYRRVLRATGRLQQVERVAPSPPSPRLQALISDDNRAIVAWTTDVAGRGVDITRVYLDASRPGIHFVGPPRLVEQFRNPPGIVLPDGSMRLVRLASEGVMMAWTGVSGGRYVVRAASVGLGALRAPAVISGGDSTDAVLADLATGPHSEALAVWTAAPRSGGGFAPGQMRILAARGVVESPGLADFSAPEAVAGPGPIATPRAAVDPASDRTVAAWQVPGRGIGYAVRDPADTSRAPVAHGIGRRTGWPLIAGTLVGLLALARARGRRSWSRRREGRGPTPARYARRQARPADPPP